MAAIIFFRMRSKFKVMKNCGSPNLTLKQRSKVKLDTYKRFVDHDFFTSKIPHFEAPGLIIREIEGISV